MTMEASATAQPINAPNSQITWALLKAWNLCSRCRQVFPDGVEVGETVDEFDSPRATLQSVEQAADGDGGCPFCKAVVEAVSRLRPSWGNDSTLKIWATDSHTVQVFNMEIETEQKLLLYILLEHYSPEEEPDGASQEFQGSLRLVKVQLESCLSDAGHQCAQSQDSNAMFPQRMLRINKTLKVVSLVNFKDSMVGQYAALSYCWGDAALLERQPPLTATCSTINKLESGIPLTDLPLTLQQAAEVCIYLGIEYLWIDALCIIQDDPDDWHGEAAKMATVYAMSKVTIIAAASTSCHSGFLQADLEPLPLQSPLRPPVRLIACAVSQSNSLLREGETGDPIDLRGWTCQEQYLSTRYIKFAAKAIQFRCLERAACMCGNPSIEVEKGGSGGYQWQETVMKLSARNFTKATDMLPALSGLARRMAPTMQSAYVAGLWKTELLSEYNADLLWYCSDPGRYSDKYIAPSFSWASVIGPVFYKQGGGEDICEIVDVSTTLVSEDEFGMVSGGSMTLRGPLIPCSIRLTTPAEPELELQPAPVQLAWCAFDCALAKSQVQGSGIQIIQRSKDPISFEKTPAHIIVVASCYWGLVLGRKQNGEGYQRLGFARLDRSPDFRPEALAELVKEITIY